MQEVGINERPIIGYAQPLSRLQVSWGAVLAGAISALAVALILWMLAMAIILTAMEPTVGSARNGLVALWITGMVSMILGAFIGGAVAGYLPGNPRRLVTCMHGFLAWCAAFLLSSMVNLAIFGGLARAATDAVMTTASTAVQTTGEAVGSAATGTTDLDRRAVALLRSLGYSPDEARQLVGSAQADLQRTLRGAQPAQGAERAATMARGALDTLFAAVATFTWLSFATWVLSGVTSVLGAFWVLKRVRLVPQRELATGDGIDRRPPAPPLRPVPEAPR